MNIISLPTWETLEAQIGPFGSGRGMSVSIRPSSERQGPSPVTKTFLVMAISSTDHPPPPPGLDAFMNLCTIQTNVNVDFINHQCRQFLSESSG